MLYHIITAYDLDHGIGLNGTIPWHLPSDLKRFKSLTTSHCVVMGRKTWDSLSRKPLPNRYNIILTSEPQLPTTTLSQNDPNWCSSFDHLDICLKTLPDPNTTHVYFIGGVSMYETACARYPIHTYYITEIYAHYNCNVICAKLNTQDNVLTESIMGHEMGISYRFQTYTKMISCNRHEEMNYLNLLRRILERGTFRADRTETGTISLFEGCQLQFSLQEHFPVLTTKQVFWRGAFEELLFFLSGKTDVRILQEKNVHIWDGNSSRAYLDRIGQEHRREGDLGKFYGFQWRHWGAEYINCDQDYTGHGLDQIKILINDIKTQPTSRRLLLTSWNPGDLNEMCLPPCHVLYQFYVNDGKLSCSMYQRSADMFLGVPFNIVGTGLLTNLLAKTCDLQPGNMTLTFGDAHIYINHIPQVLEQLTRIPKPFPKLIVKSKKSCMEDYEMNDFELMGYESWGKIVGNMAV